MRPKAMHSHYKRSKVGFPIRRSSDHSSFAAPRGLSQRTTSFIASQRQGIHRMLLRHLIALMIDVRPVPDGKGEPSKPVTSAEVTGDQKDLSSDLWDPKTFACLTHRPSTALRRRWFVGSLRLTECVTSSRCQTPASLPRKLANSSKTLDPEGSADGIGHRLPARTLLERTGSAIGCPRERWWSQTGSNRRPHACKARALPTELWPHPGARWPAIRSRAGRGR